MSPNYRTIQPFNDTDFRADLARFKAYLAECRNALDVSRIAHKDGISGHKDEAAKEHKLSALDKELSKYRSSHVYLKSAGSEQPAISMVSCRQFAAPLWATMESEQGKRRRAA